MTLTVPKILAICIAAFIAIQILAVALHPWRDAIQKPKRPAFKWSGMAMAIVALLLTGCVTDPATGKQTFSPSKWFTANQPKLEAVGSVALSQISTAAWSIAWNTLISQAETGFDGSKSFDLQTDLRQAIPTLLTSDDLKAYLTAWNTTPTAQMAALVPANLTPAAVQSVALTIADSQVVAATQVDSSNP